MLLAAIATSARVVLARWEATSVQGLGGTARGERGSNLGTLVPLVALQCGGAPRDGAWLGAAYVLSDDDGFSFVLPGMLTC